MTGNFKCLFLVGHDTKYLDIIDISPLRGYSPHGFMSITRTSLFLNRYFDAGIIYLSFDVK